MVTYLWPGTEELWGYVHVGDMAFSSGTRLECCIVGSSASLAFTIKALVILNLAPHSFGFHSIHQKL